MIDNTRSVISGSTALAVCMQRTNGAGDWMDTRDLDVFTPAGRAGDVVSYLVRHLGYTITHKFREVDSDSDSDGDSIGTNLLGDPAAIPSFVVCNPVLSGIIGLTRLQASDDRRIDVIESVTKCALFPLVHFPFTHLVNYITSTAVVVCYPRHTLVTHTTSPNPDNRLPQRIRDRYSQRGWTMPEFFVHSDECTRSPGYCPLTLRVSEDSSCFVFAYGPSVEDKKRRETSYLPQATWIWGSSRTKNCHPRIPGHDNSHVCAEYNYLH